jgi:cyclase
MVHNQNAPRAPSASGAFLFLALRRRRPMNHRIIAWLDIKGPNLVKGIKLEGLRALGRPERFARHYYESGADELVYQDVVASLYNRNSLHEIITRTAREIHIPLTVGGGIRTVDDIKAVLRAGADKISLNTAAIARPELIREAAHIFGSSTVVVNIEVIRQTDGRYLAYTDNGREHTGVEAVQWAQKVEALGAGEIVLTSVDRDGTGLGCDLEILRKVTAAVRVPVIAHGGVGRPEHVSAAIKDGDASAVAVASVIHYDAVARADRRGDADTTPTPVMITRAQSGNKEASKDSNREGNFEFIKSGRGYGKIVPASIGSIKEHLRGAGIDCRPVDDESNEGGAGG